MAAAVRSSRPLHRAGRSRDNMLAALSDVVEISSDDNRDQREHPRPGRDAYPPPSHSEAVAYAGAVPMTPAEPPLSSMPFSGNVVYRDDPLASGPPPPVPSKTGRSNAGHLQLPSSKSGMAGKLVNAFKRQTAEEKEAKRKANSNKNGQLNRPDSLGSSRMDVIDKLDASGFHGSSLFHHDSPYDACTPRANSHRRAPVKAFDPNTDAMTGLSLNDAGNSGSRRRPLPRGQPASDSKARAPVTHGGSGGFVPALGLEDTANPAGHLNSARQDYAPSESSALTDNVSVNTASDVDTADRAHGRGASVAKPNSAMAAMWGLQDDEPWQDFAAPKSNPRNKGGQSGSKTNGTSGTHYLGPYSTRDSRDGQSSATSSVLDMEALMTGQTAEEKRLAGKTYAPPSQEIAGVSPFPEPDYDRSDDGALPNHTRRNKSLLRRIKSARQNPNVPPPTDDHVEMSSRATSKRYGPNATRGAPSSPTEGPRAAGSGRDWTSLTSPHLGSGAAGTGSSSLGRNGTRRATRDEQARYYGAETNAEDARRSPSARYASNAVGGTGEGDYVGAAAGDAGPGLGRSASVFGRFGRKGRSGERTAGS